jgi:C1A family cysteine protease
MSSPTDSSSEVKEENDWHVIRLPPKSLNLRPARVTPVATAVAIVQSGVDLRSQMPPVYDQGSLGSCTANALCAAFAYIVRNFRGSRLFLYYNARVLENTTDYDAGAYIHTSINTLKTQGLCAEAGWPYVTSKFATKPPTICYRAGLQNRIINAYNVPTNLASMKASLIAKRPFVLAFFVYQSFYTMSVARTGIVPMPGKNESVMGGHAVLVCGYNDVRRWFIVRNSWGAGWGDRGYFYMPYAYFTDPALTSDVWAITSVK